MLNRSISYFLYHFASYKILPSPHTPQCQATIYSYYAPFLYPCRVVYPRGVLPRNGTLRVTCNIEFE